MFILLSVIMPVYNESLNELKDSIHSICNQTFKDFEFIIVNDNPKSKQIKNFLIKEASNDRRIKLFFNHQNMGPSFSTNKGIRMAQGQLIARMDADDISDQNRFLKQVHFLNKYNLDLCCFNFAMISPSGHLETRYAYSTNTQVNQSKIKRIMSHCSITNGPSFMFKKKIATDIGGYRTKWIEDYDFAARALVHGYRIGYQGSSLIYKRTRLNSVSNSNILKQFVGLKIISKYLRKYSFSKDVPLNIISRGFGSVNKDEINKLKVIKKYIKKYKDHKNLLYFIKFMSLICTSKLIFKFYLWTHTWGSSYGQNLLMK